MTVATRLMTAEELWELPDDGQRRRLIAGVVQTRSSGNHLHGQITMRAGGPLTVHVYAHRLGEVYAAETGFLLARNPDTVQAPDVAFVRRERAAAARQTEGPWFPGAPDLAVEVISPNDRHSEVAATIAAWLEAGCRMVLVVDPRRRTVGIYRPAEGSGERRVTELREGDTIDGGEVVPGWRLPVVALFGEEPVA